MKAKNKRLRKTSHYLSAALLSLVISTSASYSFANESDMNNRPEHPSQKHKRGGHGKALQRLLSKLDLSEQQQEAVKMINEQAKADFEANKDQTMHPRKVHSEIMGLDPDASDYSDKVATIGEQASDSAEQMVLKFADIQTKIYAVLDETQKEKFKALSIEMAIKRDLRKKEGEERPRGKRPHPYR